MKPLHKVITRYIVFISKVYSPPSPPPDHLGLSGSLLDTNQISHSPICSSFMNIFGTRATGSHGQAKLFELNFFIRKLFRATWSNQLGTTVLTAGQVAP